MELREWLIILGLVLVAIILVDGVRRLQRQRRGLRMDLSRDIDASTPARDQEDIEREERMSWELPNGGARVVSPGERDIDDRFDEPVMETSRDREAERDLEERGLEDDDLDERDAPAYRSRERHAPMRDLDESSDHEYDDEEVPPVRRRDEFARRLKSVFPFGEGKRAPREDVRLDASPSRGQAPAAPEPERPVSRGDSRRDDAWHDDGYDDDDPLFARHDRRDPLPADMAFEEDDDVVPLQEDAPEELAPSRSSQFDSTRWAARHPVLERAARGMIEGEAARDALANAEEIVVISVMSRDEDGFHGPDLLQLVLACGLRIDDRGVFHRFETESSQSPLQFSMVNVVKPGTFDLEVMEEEPTPGVTFLMPMPSAESSREAFEAMFETAMVLVRNLGGELKDENHSVMTGQTVEFARQRVHEFERRWRLHRHQVQ